MIIVRTTDKTYPKAVPDAKHLPASYLSSPHTHVPENPWKAIDMISMCKKYNSMEIKINLFFLIMRDNA